jgi:CubicO group peptidase (beta-lactamase class C family)
MELADEIAAAMDAYPGRHSLSGVILISRDGERRFERAYGEASVQLGVINRPQTRFHIASVTKMFISAAVVRLACEGRLSLQAHPAEYLAYLGALDPRITLHQLLSHTAGVADVYDQPELRLAMTRLALGGGRLLDYLVALPPLFEPGARWRYSSSGFLLLAYVVEAATGMRFAEALRQLFFDPLGMADTGPDDPFRVNPGRASGHTGRDGAWGNAGNDLLAEIEAPREHYSTAADLDRWGTALLRGETLTTAGLDLTFTPHAKVGEGSGFDPSLSYGYGWFLGPRHRWIGGMTAGFRAQMWQFPEERLNVVMLWNNEATDSQRLFNRLRPLLLG